MVCTDHGLAYDMAPSSKVSVNVKRTAEHVTSARTAEHVTSARTPRTYMYGVRSVVTIFFTCIYVDRTQRVNKGECEFVGLFIGLSFSRAPNWCIVTETMHEPQKIENVNFATLCDDEMSDVFPIARRVS